MENNQSSEQFPFPLSLPLLLSWVPPTVTLILVLLLIICLYHSNLLPCQISDVPGFYFPQFLLKWQLRELTFLHTLQKLEPFIIT
jgi:hypothetical protein